MLAVITGASRGIGESYARQLAARGYGLHVVARDADRLAAVAQGVRAAHSVPVEEIVLDLAHGDSAERLYAEVRSRQSAPVDLLINNAGFGLYGEFTDIPTPRLQEMVYLHTLTVTKLMRLFLPEMRARRSGAIINVASIAGLLPLPYMALYAATKSFQVSLGLSIGDEVRADGVIVQTCCPGQTLTDFHATADRTPPAAHGSELTAAQVVSESLAALDRGSAMVITGSRNRLLMRIERLVPRVLVQWATARALKPSGAR
jgi:short-subunit dehydrogenase